MCQILKFTCAGNRWVGMQLRILIQEWHWDFFPLFETLWFRNDIEIYAQARLFCHLKTDLAIIWFVWQISNTYAPFNIKQFWFFLRKYTPVFVQQQHRIRISLSFFIVPAIHSYIALGNFNQSSMIFISICQCSW